MSSRWADWSSSRDVGCRLHKGESAVVLFVEIGVRLTSFSEWLRGLVCQDAGSEEGSASVEAVHVHRIGGKDGASSESMAGAAGACVRG